MILTDLAWSRCKHVTYVLQRLLGGLKWEKVLLPVPRLPIFGTISLTPVTPWGRPVNCKWRARWVAATQRLRVVLIELGPVDSQQPGRSPAPHLV